MRVLVIGGAGYIGSHVVLDLLDKKHQVRVLDNLSSGRRENILPSVEFIEGDILDSDVVRQAMVGVDAVVHLAAKKAVGESMRQPEKYAVNNITGTLNVLNAMAETGVNCFVFSSSAAVYGMPAVSKITEEEPVNPINFYGFTKLEIERCLSWYSRLKGIKFVALRYFNAVGYDAKQRILGLEQNPQNLLPIVMETAVGSRAELNIYGNDYPTPDGTCIRDYIHVSDLASAHTLALDYLRQGGDSQVLNLGTGQGQSVLDIVRAVESVIGRALPYRFVSRRDGDPAVLIALADKARKILGWAPVHSQTENIVRTTWAVYNRK